MEVMESTIATLTAFVTAALGWMGQVLDAVQENPLLLIFVFGFPVAGFGISLLARLVRV